MMIRILPFDDKSKTYCGQERQTADHTTDGLICALRCRCGSARKWHDKSHLVRKGEGLGGGDGDSSSSKRPETDVRR